MSAEIEAAQALTQDQAVVIVGGGQAGSSCAIKLRNLGFKGRITLIGDEPYPPYQRPPLSKKYLQGDIEEERLYLRPLSFYAEHAIDLRLECEVSGIDRAARELHLEGSVLPYDQLVLTTGSTPRRLPASIGGDKEGIFTVRGIDDITAMAPYFKAQKHVLVVGGGYIGLEAAAVAAQRGLKVTLIEMAPRILGRVAAPETADYFRGLHKRHGVEILENIGLIELTGEAHVRAARLSTGAELAVDFVIVGIGITPNDALARDAGIAVENGVAVNARGQSSDPHIWAAGDCASFPYCGERIRLESVGNAIDQAEIVARNIMGEEVDYSAKPWFWSDQYETKLQIAGLNRGYDQIVTREGDAGERTHWYFRAGELISIDAMNDPRGYMIGKRLIEAGVSPDPALIADPAVNLKTLLK